MVDIGEQCLILVNNDSARQERGILVIQWHERMNGWKARRLRGNIVVIPNISWEWLSNRGYTGSYPSWWDGTSSCRQEILCLDCRSIYLNAVAKHSCLGGHPHLSSGYLVVHPRNPKWMIALETMVDVGHRNTSPTGTSIEWCNSVTNISGKGLPSGYG